MTEGREKPFSVGGWRVEPMRCALIDKSGESRHLEPKVMDTLVYLAAQPRILITRDELLESVWGEHAQSDETLTRAVSELRRALGDDSRHPSYIETVPKRGYRLVAPVTRYETPEKAASGKPESRDEVTDAFDLPVRRIIAFAVIALVAIVGMINVNLDDGDSSPPRLDVASNSIAVLPFRNHSRRNEDLPFVDGMHDDIINQLGKLAFFEKVISRTSTERYRDSTMAAPQIAGELGVRTILEGGVNRVGERIRVNVALIDAPSDELLWTETYERRLTTGDIFDIQDDITLAVASALHARLSAQEQDQVSQFPTADLAAYDAYLRGKQAMAQRTVDRLREARSWFEDAIALDPEFALAHVALADSMTLLVLFGGLPESDYDEAEAAARRAIQLNDRLGEAYASLGLIGWRHARFRLSDYAPVEVNFLRAQELAPHYEPAFHWYALLLADIGKLDDALSVMRRAIALNPLHANLHANLGVLHGRRGEMEEALDSLGRALELDPLYAPAMTALGELHLLFGKPVEAISWFRKSLAIDPSRQQAIARQISAYLALGSTEEVDALYLRLMDLPPTFWQKVYAMVVEASRGDFDAAEAAAVSWLTENDECTFCLEIVLHVRLLREDPGGAIEMVNRYAPSLLDRSQDVLQPRRLFLLAPLAKALQQTGRDDDAEALLEFGLEQSATIPRLLMGERGRGIEDVRMLALLGRHDDAIAAFEDAIDAGWRFRHRAIEMLYLEPLPEDPRFVAIRTRHDEGMAKERSRLAELEQRGEIAAL